MIKPLYQTLSNAFDLVGNTPESSYLSSKISWVIDKSWLMQESRFQAWLICENNLICDEKKRYHYITDVQIFLDMSEVRRLAGSLQNIVFLRTGATSVLHHYSGNPTI